MAINDIGRYHIIFDIHNVSIDKLTNKKELKDLLVNLTKLIGMKILHGPVIVEGVPENPGITGFVIVDYSHISIHTFTSAKQAMIDVFSCSEYDIEKPREAIAKYFEVELDKLTTRTVKWSGQSS